MNTIFERNLMEGGVNVPLTREYRLQFSFALMKELQESILNPLNKLPLRWTSSNVGPEMVSVSFGYTFSNGAFIVADILPKECPFNSDYRSLEIEVKSMHGILADKVLDIPRDRLSGMLHNVKEEAEWIAAYKPFLDELEDIYNVFQEYGDKITRVWN